MENLERKPVDFKKERPQLFKMKGISAKTVEEHLKIYEGYVKKFNEITQKLNNLTDEDYNAANPTYSSIRELKVEWTRAFGGMINHEIYFSHLGGEGGKPGSSLGSQIDKDFGSFEKFVKEMKATAMGARGWAWLLWSDDLNRLVISISDEQNTYMVQNSKLILALDVFEHAYYLDYGSNRKGYVDIFFDNIDWPVVEKRFEALKV
ncbi:MAG: superoxide dismutase [Candidatus Nanopusillus sp.]|nr:superoxide dismutase [Candidatus Nanopusillus sp.]